MNILQVTIHAASLEKLHELENLNLDLVRSSAQQLSENDYSVSAIVTKEQVEELKMASFTVELESDESSVPIQRLGEVSRVNRFETTGAEGAMALVAETTQGYMTVEEIDAALTHLQRQYPETVSLITLPNKTWEGRTCRAIRVNAGSPMSTATKKNALLITGNVHAREWGGSEICLNLLTKLLGAYSNRQPLHYGNKIFDFEKVMQALEGVELFVFPEVNPDGKVYCQTNHEMDSFADMQIGNGFWWRKNRRPDETGKPVGVDLNRNFDFLWDSGIGTSMDKQSLIYRGPAPFSEPESLNIRHLFDTYPQIRFFTDIHSYGEKIMYNWGDDDNQTTNPEQNFMNRQYDRIRGSWKEAEINRYKEYIVPADEQLERELGNRMNTALKAVRGKAYTVQESNRLYHTSGTTQDYAYSRHLVDPSKPKIYSFTIEFGTVFVPAFVEMQLIMEDVCSALTEQIYALSQLSVTEPVHG